MTPSHSVALRLLLIAVIQTFGACATAASLKEAGLSLDLPESLTLSARVESHSVVFKGPDSQVWSFNRIDVQSLEPGKSAPWGVAAMLESFRSDLPGWRRNLRDSVHEILDESDPDSGVLVLVGYQMRREGGLFYSHVEFKRLWPSKIPDAYVQGTIDWKGELHPAFAEVLNVLRKTAPSVAR